MGSVRPGSAGNFFSAIMLVIVSLFVLQQSFEIYIDAAVPAKVSPALLPAFLGCCVLICAAVILLKTLKGQKTADIIAVIVSEVKGWFGSAESDWQRVLGGLALLGSYIFLLIPIFEFWLSTSIFLILTYSFLRAAAWWKIGIITIGAVGGIILLFQQIFSVKLP